MEMGGLSLRKNDGWGGRSNSPLKILRTMPTFFPEVGLEGNSLNIQHIKHLLDKAESIIEK